MNKYEKIANLLSPLGLNKKEIAIYLALLKRGWATVSQIANETGIARTYVYDIAADLQEKGFLSTLERRGVRSFAALNHSELVAFIKRKNEELGLLNKKIQEAVSDFESIRQDTKPPTSVEFFSGVDGVLNIYDQIKSDLIKLNEPFEIITIFSPEKIEATFPGWFDTKKYIDVSSLMIKRDIVHDSEIFNKHLQQRKEGKGKYYFKIWPKERGEFPVDTLCWENKVAFIELTEFPTGTIIENAAVAKTFKMWFEKMWESL